MATNAKAELESIIREMDKIITELGDISYHVRYDFKNVGNDLCANCIDNVKSDCQSARRALKRIDTSKMKD